MILVLPEKACKKELIRFGKAVVDLKDMVKVGLVNLTAEEVAVASEYRVDPKALEKAPCDVQVGRCALTSVSNTLTLTSGVFQNSRTTQTPTKLAPAPQDLY